MKTIYWHRNLVSGDCGENFHRELAVLADLIVKPRPWANFPWGVNRPPCQSLAGRWEGGRVLQKCFILSEFLWRIFSYHVSSLSLSRPILYLFQTDWLMKGCARLRVWVRSEGGRGGVALSSLLRASLRWLDWIFWRGYLPSLSINYIAMSNVLKTCRVYL